MDKIIRKHAGLDARKADEFRYWQSRPAHERIAEITLAAYPMKEMSPFERTLVRLQRSES